jgi:hypothetical protein
MRDASRRAEALASAFRAENQALIALVVGMDEREWASDCPDEGRSVGVMVGHIAEGHLIIGQIVRAIARAVRCRFRHSERSSKARRTRRDRPDGSRAPAGTTACGCSGRTRSGWRASSAA